MSKGRRGGCGGGGMHHLTLWFVRWLLLVAEALESAALISAFLCVCMRVCMCAHPPFLR